MATQVEFWRVDHGVQRAGLDDLADLLFAIGGIDVGALLEAVGEAGGVPQQVDDQHRPRGGLVRNAGAVPAWNTPRFFHSGMYLCTGSSIATRPSSTSIMKATLGDRLGHRIDAEDGVVLDRHLALDVGKALHRECTTLPRR